MMATYHKGALFYLLFYSFIINRRILWLYLHSHDFKADTESAVFLTDFELQSVIDGGNFSQMEFHFKSNDAFEPNNVLGLTGFDYFATQIIDSICFRIAKSFQVTEKSPRKSPTIALQHIEWPLKAIFTINCHKMLASLFP